MRYVLFSFKNGYTVIGEVKDNVFSKYYWRDSTHYTEQGPFDSLSALTEDYEATLEGKAYLDKVLAPLVPELKNNVVQVDFILKRRLP